MIRNVFALIYGCVAMVIATGGGAAQAPPDTAGQAPIELDRIVVTATRESVPAVTASATVLSGQALRARGVTRVADALREVPGVAVVRTGSFGGVTSLYLRGGEEGYTRVLLDGVPLNEPGGSVDLAHLTTEAVDRIEVVRGPASVLYGTDAMTGVIQIFTRTGDGAPRVRAAARAGTYGALELDAGVSGGLAGVTYSFGASRFHTDGIHAFNNAYDNTVFTGSARVMPDDRTDLGFRFQYGDNEYHVPTDGSGRAVDRNAFSFGQRFAVGVDATRRLSSRLDAQLLLALRSSDGGFDDTADDAADTVGFFASSSLERVVRRSAELRLSYTLAPEVVLSGGAQVEEQEERSFSESDSEFGPSSSSFDASRTNSAAYAQLTGAAGRWSVNAGVRADHNDAFGDFVTVRSGLAFAATPTTRLRAAFGTAFREPTFFQNFAQGFVRGNPDLEPERARSWDAGIEQRVGASAVVSATWFTQRFRDVIEYSATPIEPSGANYVNVAGANASGLELEARAASGRISSSASYTWLRSRVTAGTDSTVLALFRPGEALLRRPEHSASMRVGYAFGDRARVDVAAHGFGERDDLDFELNRRVELPAYATLDVSAELEPWRAGPSRPRLTLRVENALDAGYQAVRGFDSPGRAFVVGVAIGR